MLGEVWIMHQGDQFRLLYGHLYLAHQLDLVSEVFVDVKDEGPVRVTRTAHGLMVEQNSQCVKLVS